MNFSFSIAERICDVIFLQLNFSGSLSDKIPFPIPWLDLACSYLSEERGRHSFFDDTSGPGLPLLICVQPSGLKDRPFGRTARPHENVPFWQRPEDEESETINRDPHQKQFYHCNLGWNLRAMRMHRAYLPMSLLIPPKSYWESLRGGGNQNITKVGQCLQHKGARSQLHPAPAGPTVNPNCVHIALFHAVPSVVTTSFKAASLQQNDSFQINLWRTVLLAHDLLRKALRFGPISHRTAGRGTPRRAPPPCVCLVSRGM